ncbi:MAG: peptidoglycan editing factor PgeF [Lachnospiraceae bacterium]|nr:peptidoglycan editing factor PgeF [Lachnospiraceae bacterium]
MEQISMKGLPALVFPELAAFPFVSHLFTTRQGGVSEGEFSSLNLSFTRGDKEEAVIENFRRVANALSVTLDRFVFTDQTHGTVVGHVTKEDAGKGLTREKDYEGVDALITDTPGLVLSAFFADCVPLFFVDPVHKAIGLAHAGWRGTVGRIGEAVVREMEYAFGTDPQDIHAAIGPSICQSCFEVDADVALQFREAFMRDERAVIRRKNDEKYEIDLWYANEIVLTDAGVPFDQITVGALCTSCRKNLLFSHRATKGRRGNLGAFLMIREPRFARTGHNRAPAAGLI